MRKKKQRRKPIEKKKKKSIKPFIIAMCAVVAAVVVAAVSYIVWQNTSLEATDLVNRDWVSVEAFDKNNKKVDIFEVYNVDYFNYNGRLGLNGDGSFKFWMSPGDEDDGTHTGKYSYDREKQTLEMSFDSGDKATYKIIRKKDGTIERIEVPYNGYKVYFIENLY